MGEGAAAPITAIIVDDERLACDELSYLLRGFPDIEVVGTGKNGLEAIRLIEDLEPDLAFLDVQMPGLDGLGVIQRVKEKNLPLPFFVLATAFDQYAVPAFRLETMDYLLKPVDKDRLTETVDRVRRLIQEKQKAAPAEVPASPVRPFSQRTKLLVRTGNRNFIIDANELVYATIDNGLISMVTTTLEGQSNYRTIEELQANLDPDVFWRVHRSYLVNINRIKEVIPWFKSSYQLRMDDKKGAEIPVSRVQTKKLRALLKL